MNYLTYVFVIILMRIVNSIIECIDNFRIRMTKLFKERNLFHDTNKKLNIPYYDMVVVPLGEEIDREISAFLDILNKTSEKMRADTNVINIDEEGVHLLTKISDVKEKIFEIILKAGGKVKCKVTRQDSKDSVIIRMCIYKCSLVMMFLREENIQWTTTEIITLLETIRYGDYTEDKEGGAKYRITINDMDPMKLDKIIENKYYDVYNMKTGYYFPYLFKKEIYDAMENITLRDYMDKSVNDFLTLKQSGLNELGTMCYRLVCETHWLYEASDTYVFSNNCYSVLFKVLTNIEYEVIKQDLQDIADKMHKDARCYAKLKIRDPRNWKNSLYDTSAIMILTTRPIELDIWMRVLNKIYDYEPSVYQREA